MVDIDNQNLKDATGRIKNICGIVGSVNAETFKRNLSKYMNSSMSVYQELVRITPCKSQQKGVILYERKGAATCE